ncbi:unnamed protein product [Ectocarpus sp. 12 AP-2014]
MSWRCQQRCRAVHTSPCRPPSPRSGGRHAHIFASARLRVFQPKKSRKLLLLHPRSRRGISLQEYTSTIKKLAPTSQKWPAPVFSWCTAVVQQYKKLEGYMCICFPLFAFCMFLHHPLPRRSLFYPPPEGCLVLHRFLLFTRSIYFYSAPLSFDFGARACVRPLP